MVPLYPGMPVPAPALLQGFRVYILGLYKDNGKGNGNYRDYRVYTGIMGHILGLYRDNGKGNGNYYNGVI